MNNVMTTAEKVANFFNSDEKILFNFAALHSGRQPIIDYIKSQPKPFRVLDLGCGADLWTYEVVELAVDMYEEHRIRRVVNGTPIPVDISNITYFGKTDLTRESGWQTIMDYVAEHGKFDFVVNSHFLEDIALPELVLDLMPKVAKMGYIATPSAHNELGPGRSGQTHGAKGYDHHRAIFHPGYKHSEKGELLLIPKFSHVERVDYKLSQDYYDQEIQVFWKDEIPYSNIFDYLEKIKSNLAGKQYWHVYNNLAFTK